MRRRLILALAGALLATSVFAGTTGTLKGKVTDDDGSALPGATVTATAPTQIGGAQVTVADDSGHYIFPALTPGFFTVKAELDGFVARERAEIQVRLDRVTEVDFELGSGQFEEQVMVTAEAPVIDPEQVSVGQTFTEEYLQKSAVGNSQRSYQTVLSQAAGVANVGGNVNPNVFGSTRGENAFYIDGFNTTDPVTSTFSGNYSFDVIQEISFQTGGFEAEFGNATGGVVNVITKSGGNDFSGTFDIRYFDDSFFEDGEFFDTDTQDTSTQDISGTLGGPLVRDKFWFFLAYNPVTTEVTSPGAPTTRTYDGANWLSKFSYQLSPSWRVVLKANGDPADIENSSFSTAQFRPPETQSIQEQGGTLLQLDLAGVLNADALWDLRGGTSRRVLNALPISGDLETPGGQNVSTRLYFDNYTNAQFSDRDRDFFATSLTWFQDDLAGNHELKGGVEINDTVFSSANYTTGSYSFTRRIVQGQDIFRNFSYDPDRSVAEFSGEQVSAYLQDSWSPNDRLTLKLGVRYDQAAFENNAGVETADLSKLQPRIGFAWDVTGTGQTIVRGSWGRFMHPSALTSASFARNSSAALPSVTAWSCEYVRTFTFGLPFDSGVPCSALIPTLQAAFGWDGSIIQEPLGRDGDGWIVSSILGAGVPNAVDPNLDATYQDSIIFGVERQIARRTSVELSYIDKSTEDIFDDTCNGNFPTPMENADCAYYFMYNIPGLRREYSGAILRVESRATDWLHLTSSLTYSQSEGNIEYTQNSGIDFDIFPDHFENTFGYLSDHRDWRFKLNGFVDLPADFILGFDTSWSSASVWDILEPAENAGYGNRYVEPRGSGKGNSNYQIDVQITKRFRIGDVDLQAIGAVINVLDDERPNTRCEQVGGCTDVNGHSVALLEPINWQNPRRFEVGFRVEF